MKRILAEPLLHFLLLGAGLFLAYSLMSSNRRGDERGGIVVTRGQIEHLAASFFKTRQRPPSAEELAALVRDRVREIPELTEDQFSRAIPSHLRKRFMRGAVRVRSRHCGPAGVRWSYPGAVRNGDGYQRAHPAKLGAGQTKT